jgi:hypothetical protein
MAGGDAIEGRRHFGVAEIDRRNFEVGLGAQDGRAGLGEFGLGVVDARLRRKLLLAQGRLPGVFDLRVGLRGLVGLQRRLRLVELGLIGVLLDDE